MSESDIFIISANIISKQKIEFRVTNETLISEIIDNISKKHGVSIDRIKIKYNGIEINKNFVIGDLHIKDNDKIIIHIS